MLPKISMLGLLLGSFGLLHAQEYDDYIGVGHDNGITVTSSSSSNGTSAQNTVNGFGMSQHLEDASRFLAQATLGVDYETIDAVAELGLENWIDQQYATEQMSYLDTTMMIWDHFVEGYIEEWGE
ncbi:MAG: hypothetical protein HKN32_02185, partial [Flavobacteriales bacterium]|nr:hypothetical protein [Flavobacteriales bacterium]